MKVLLTSLLLLMGMTLFAQDTPIIAEETAKMIENTKPRYYSEECELIKDKKERQSCAETALVMKMYRSMSYPASARKNGVSGTVMLSYVVKADGTLGEITVRRSVSPELDATAIKGLQSVGKWVPGTEGGRPVDMTQSMPVKFSL